MSKKAVKQSVANSKPDLAGIMSELDRWVASHGNGQYNPPEYEPLDELALYPDYSIQQVRSEIQDFVDEILKRDLTGTMVEIGIGYYGSTHFLWRLLFERVITVEKSSDRCRAFAHRYSDFYKGLWPTSDGRSAFIFGLSSDPSVVRKAYDVVGAKADVLFIDGDHSYQGVLCDWLLYHKLVRKGGIVAFHDCSTDCPRQSEVPPFLHKLENGEIDGQHYKLKRIAHSRHLGIAFYEYA